MTYTSSPSLLRKVLLALAAGMLINACPAWAGPGAHGPNGEHLDPDTSAHGDAASSAALPRFDAQSDVFEVVGQMNLPHGDGPKAEPGELSLLIDRFDTNEPVLKASVEVASGNVKAVATFHEDHGDYSVTDPALLAKLSQPGSHPLVITIESGDDADLLDGKLVTPDRHDEDQTHRDGGGLSMGRSGLIAALVVAAALAVLAWVYLRRKHEGVTA